MGPSSPATRRCAIEVPTTKTDAFRQPTATMLASTDLEIDTALLARAVAEVTDHRPRTTWEAVTVRDAATGTPELTEVCSWLPNAADVRFGRQRMGNARVLAAVPGAFVGSGSVSIVVLQALPTL